MRSLCLLVSLLSALLVLGCGQSSITLRDVNDSAGAADSQAGSDSDVNPDSAISVDGFPEDVVAPPDATSDDGVDFLDGGAPDGLAPLPDSGLDGATDDADDLTAPPDLTDTALSDLTDADDPNTNDGSQPPPDAADSGSTVSKVPAPTFDLLPPQVGKVEVVVRWDKVDDERVTGYQILRGAGDLETLTVLHTVGKDITSFSDVSVQMDTVYGYRVIATSDSAEVEQPETRTVVGMTYATLSKFDSTMGHLEQGQSDAEWLHRELSQGVKAASAFSHAGLTRTVYVHTEDGQLAAVAAALKSAGISVLDGQTLQPLMGLLELTDIKSQLEAIQNHSAVTRAIIGHRGAITGTTDNGDAIKQSCEWLLAATGARYYPAEGGVPLKIGFIDGSEDHWNMVRANLSCLATKNGKLSMDITDNYVDVFNIYELGEMALVKALQSDFNIVNASVQINSYSSVEKNLNIIKNLSGWSKTLVVLAAGNAGQYSRRGYISTSQALTSQFCKDSRLSCCLTIYVDTTAARVADKKLTLDLLFEDETGASLWGWSRDVQDSAFDVCLLRGRQLKLRIHANSEHKNLTRVFMVGNGRWMTGYHDPGYSIHGWNALPQFLTVGGNGGNDGDTMSSLDSLGRRIDYSSVGPGVMWRQYKIDSPSVLEFTDKPDINMSHFQLLSPGKAGGTSAAAPTVAGMAALIMSRRRGEGAEPGPELVKAVVAELKARAKRTDADCKACQPKEIGPIAWSDPAVHYGHHYGVGLAQLTWERFDWLGWSKISNGATLLIKEDEWHEPEQEGPNYFTREWQLHGGYWCSLYNYQTGECYGTDPPSTVTGEICACNEYEYRSETKWWLNKHYETEQQLVDAYCGNPKYVHPDGNPLYLACKAICHCAENHPLAGIGLSKRCKGGGCFCPKEDSEWVWTSPGETACKQVLQYKRLVCTDLNGDKEISETCQTTQLVSGEFWDPLAVSLGPESSKVRPLIQLLSGPSPNQNDHDQADNRSLRWASTTNDPPVPVDANSRFRAKLTAAGQVRLRIGTANGKSREICVVNDGDFCKNADMTPEPDDAGVISVRLGELFGSELFDDQIDSLEFQLGNDAMLHLHFVDISPKSQ